MHAAVRAEGLLAPSSTRFRRQALSFLCKGLGSLLSYPLLLATLCFNPAQKALRRPADQLSGVAGLELHSVPSRLHLQWIYAYMAGDRTSTSLWLSDSYSFEFGVVCQWWLLSSSFQCGYVAFHIFFPFPKSNTASQYANDDWHRPTSIVDLTAREPCRTFSFAKHVSFEHSIGISCPVISSWEGNINQRTTLKSFLTLDRWSVSPYRPACVWALRGHVVGDLAGAATSLATESIGTVLTPSQMSEIAGHGRPYASSSLPPWHLFLELLDKDCLFRHPCSWKSRAHTSPAIKGWLYAWWSYEDQQIVCWRCSSYHGCCHQNYLWFAKEPAIWHMPWRSMHTIWILQTKSWPAFVFTLRSTGLSTTQSVLQLSGWTVWWYPLLWTIFTLSLCVERGYIGPSMVPRPWKWGWNFFGFFKSLVLSSLALSLWFSKKSPTRNKELTSFTLRYVEAVYQVSAQLTKLWRCYDLRRFGWFFGNFSFSWKN